MQIILYIILGIVGLLILLILFAPKAFAVERDIIIQKPKAEVFNYVRSLRDQQKWSAWAKKDPNQVVTYTGTDGHAGATAHWVGNKEVGEGVQEIKKVVEGERIDSQLRFIKPFKSQSDCYFITEDAGDNNTKLRWGFTGKMNPPMNVFMLFMNMDKTVGKDFEEGLGNLKAILEH